jgi:hypothetical protein
VLLWLLHELVISRGWLPETLFVSEILHSHYEGNEKREGVIIVKALLNFLGFSFFSSYL